MFCVPSVYLFKLSHLLLLQKFQSHYAINQRPCLNFFILVSTNAHRKKLRRVRWMCVVFATTKLQPMRSSNGRLQKSGLHRSQRRPPAQDTDVLFDGRQQAGWTSFLREGAHWNLRSILVESGRPSLLQLNCSWSDLPKDMSPEIFTSQISKTPSGKRFRRYLQFPTASRMKKFHREEVELCLKKYFQIIFETKFHFFSLFKFSWKSFYNFFLFPPFLSCFAGPRSRVRGRRTGVSHSNPLCRAPLFFRQTDKIFDTQRGPSSNQKMTGKERHNSRMVPMPPATWVLLMCSCCRRIYGWRSRCSQPRTGRKTTTSAIMWRSAQTRWLSERATTRASPDWHTSSPCMAGPRCSRSSSWCPKVTRMTNLKQTSRCHWDSSPLGLGLRTRGDTRRRGQCTCTPQRSQGLRCCHICPRMYAQAVRDSVDFSA